jgi:hypothetical protein
MSAAARKFVLVPSEVVSRMQSVYPNVHRVQGDIARDNMSRVLETQYADDAEKYAQLVQEQQQYMTHRRALEQPLRFGIEDGDTGVGGSTRVGKLEDVLHAAVNSIPPHQGRVRDMARFLMATPNLEWNNRGEVYTDGVLIPNSSLSRLMSDSIHREHQQQQQRHPLAAPAVFPIEPVGRNEFDSVLNRARTVGVGQIYNAATPQPRPHSTFFGSASSSFSGTPQRTTVPARSLLDDDAPSNLHHSLLTRSGLSTYRVPLIPPSAYTSTPDSHEQFRRGSVRGIRDLQRAAETRRQLFPGERLGSPSSFLPPARGTRAAVEAAAAAVTPDPAVPSTSSGTGGRVRGRGQNRSWYLQRLAERGAASVEAQAEAIDRDEEGLENGNQSGQGFGTVAWSRF